MNDSRPRLPLLGDGDGHGDGHGGPNRSAMTCLHRCANACDHPAPNTSGNEYFGDGVQAAARTGFSRRGVIAAAGAGAITLGLACAGMMRASSDLVQSIAAGGDAAGGRLVTARPGPRLTFTPVPPSRRDEFVVPAGYRHSVIIRWGDPVLPGAPAFDPRQQTGKAQSAQFGFNNDFTAIMPLENDDSRVLLVVNHEYTTEDLMIPGFTGMEDMSVEQVKAMIAAHGLSVVELERVGGTGEWRVAADGPRTYNRRITTLSTVFTLTGPAAGSKLLRTEADPGGRKVVGTLNNCSGGVTPWGTVLSGEENFNGYFVGGDGAPPELSGSLNRYGIRTDVRYSNKNRMWERADQRFDLARHPHEAHRFGWIVEIDPYDPQSTPRKHTALGRFKHEGATIAVAENGHVVAYMGDDERFDYIYKFVSHRTYRPGAFWWSRKQNMNLLESGDLYVAKFDFHRADDGDGDEEHAALKGPFSGKGTWLPLVKGDKSKVDGMSVDEVLVFTRLAADRVGATKMDRPEGIDINRLTGKIYAALTNNIYRGVAQNPPANGANPRKANKHGHIIELTEDGGDHTATRFTWTIPIVCGDPRRESTYFMGYDKSKVSPISSPDNLMFDPSGHLWIATDGTALGQNNGLFATALQGPEAGHVKQFLTVPRGAEACGPSLTPDGRSVFVAVQHPGEVTGASWDEPASTWPDGDQARPAVAVVWHPEGHPIGEG